MEGPWSSWDNMHTEKKRMLSPAGGGLVDRGKHREKSRVWAIAETLISQAIMGRAGSRPTKAQGSDSSWQRPAPASWPAPS